MVVAIEGYNAYDGGDGSDQNTYLQHSFIQHAIPVNKIIRYCDKAEDVHRYHKLLAEAKPFERITPEAAEQDVEQVGRDNLEERLSPEFFQTADENKDAEDKDEPGENPVGVTILVEKEITAREYTVRR
jgi:hypothetical protein